jgi:hypothetical protein
MRIAFTALAFMCAAAACGDPPVEGPDAGPDPYEACGVVRGVWPNEASYPMNRPSFCVVDAQLATMRVGDLAQPGAMRAVSEQLFPDHFYDEFVSSHRPETPHAGPYETEISRHMAFWGVTPSRRFAVADLMPPEGVVIAAMAVPHGQAERGPSPDFEDGPVIPGDAFPLEVYMHLQRFDGTSWQEQTGGMTYLSGSASHTPIFNIFQTDEAPQAGDYLLSIEAYEPGFGPSWVLAMPFTVE